MGTRPLTGTFGVPVIILPLLCPHMSAVVIVQLKLLTAPSPLTAAPLTAAPLTLVPLTLVPRPPIIVKGPSIAPIGTAESAKKGSAKNSNPHTHRYMYTHVRS